MASASLPGQTIVVAVAGGSGNEDAASNSSSSSSSSSDSIMGECIMTHRHLTATPSAPIPGKSAMMDQPERTYIFPMLSSSVPSRTAMSKGHGRSVSHGGGAMINPVGANPQRQTGTTTLKSALRGHQRAFSQGQITESGNTGGTTGGPTTNPPRSGHSRVGSKTDFILPPGHKEAPVNREQSTSASISGGRGHSRQASRSESIYTIRRDDVPPWWKRFLFCRPPKREQDGRYVVVPNHTVPAKTPKREHPNGFRTGNKIHTTKYTLLSFVPKNLLEQFHRVANLYFIFIVLLNWFPAINAFGKEIAMIPVLFVLGVTAIKDLFEDRRRRASDQRINNTTCRVYSG